MKLNKYFLIGTIAVAGLSSCVSEDLGNGAEKTETGRMTLDVSLLNPRSTRAGEAETETTKFPVSIVEKTSGEEVKTYETVLDIPEPVVLPVGNYTVKSHTPGDLEKKMTAPYYAGEKDMEIVKDLTTETKVVCKMQNSSITVKYDESFKAKFTEWTITLNDDTEAVLSYTKEDGTEPSVVYWLFGERVSELKLNINAKTADNKTITHKASIKKGDASESYDDDEDIYFKGGDALVFNFKAVASAEGTVTGIEVTAQETFFEDEEEIVKDLEVTDKTDENQGGGDEEDPTPGEDANITLDLPKPISFAATDVEEIDPSIGDTYIAAENGLKSIYVRIESNSEEMMDAISDLAENYEGVDFVKGTEIVENQEVVRLFEDLSQDLTVPAEGDEEYTFPIGNFFLFLSVLPGEHTFILTVTDTKGHSESGQVIVTVIEEDNVD